MNIKKILKNRFVSRCLACVLLLFFTAATFWWTFHIPYKPEKLLRSVPFDAALVSAHENLQIGQLTSNPLIKDLYANLKQQIEEHGIDIESPLAQSIINRLTGNFLLVSYTPSCRFAGDDDIWTIASWIGADSIWLRWIFNLKKIPGITRLQHSGPRPMWHIDLSPDLSLSFAFDEGILVACISQTPLAIHDVMLTYEGRIPGMITRHGTDYFEQLFEQNPERPLGKGIANYSLFLENHYDKSLLFEIEEFSEHRIAGSALLNETGTQYPAFADTDSFHGLSLLTGDAASAICFFSQSLLNLAETGFNNDVLNNLAHELKELLASEPEGIVALGVFTGEFSGRFGTPPLRPTVPSLMLFVRTHRQSGVIESVQRAIDHLNTHFRTGLIIKPDPVQAGNHSIFAVEATSGDFLTDTDPDDMPAFVHIGDWVIISSNLRGLTRLAAQMQTETWQDKARKCEWLGQINNLPATVYSWLDTDTAGQSAQLMIAAYAFSLMGRTDPATQAAITRLTTIRKWIDKIRPLGSCGIWLNMEEPRPTFNFELKINQD